MRRTNAKPQSRSYPARRWQRYAGVTFRKGNRAATKTGPTRRRNPSGRRRGVWELGRLCLPHAAHSSARRRNFDLAEVSFLRVDQAGCAECWRTPILFWCRSVRELGWQDESAQQTNAIFIANGWKASCSKPKGKQGNRAFLLRWRRRATSRSVQRHRRFADAMAQTRHRCFDEITAQTRTHQDREEIPRRLLKRAKASPSQLRSQLWQEKFLPEVKTKGNRADPPQRPPFENTPHHAVRLNDCAHDE
jgi:hypothetical protein